MQARTYHLGTIAGFRIQIHPSWLIILVLLTSTLAMGWFPQALPGQTTGLYWSAGFLATLHITAAMPDEALVERLNVDLAENPYKPWNEISGGRAAIPQGPGLGCDPDPDIVARYRTHEPHIVR